MYVWVCVCLSVCLCCVCASWKYFGLHHHTLIHLVTASPLPLQVWVIWQRVLLQKTWFIDLELKTSVEEGSFKVRLLLRDHTLKLWVRVDVCLFVFLITFIIERKHVRPGMTVFSLMCDS